MHVALLSSILLYLSIFSKVAASIESEMLVEELPPPDEIGLASEIGTGSFEVAESGLSDGRTDVVWGGGTGEVCVPLLGLSEI